MGNYFKWFSVQILQVVETETGDIEVYLSTTNARTQDDEYFPNHWPLMLVSPTVYTFA